MLERVRDSALGQLPLPLVVGGLGSVSAPGAVVPAPAPEERPGPLDHAVDCPVGCRGTTDCLCGQGEFSDDPLWIEND